MKIIIGDLVQKLEHRASHNRTITIEWSYTFVSRVDEFDDNSFYVWWDWQAMRGEKVNFDGKLAHLRLCLSISCHDYDLCEIPLWYIWCLMLKVALNAENKWNKFYIIEESWGFSTFFVQNCTMHCAHCCTVPTVSNANYNKVNTKHNCRFCYVYLIFYRMCTQYTELIIRRENRWKQHERFEWYACIRQANSSDIRICRRPLICPI